MWCDKCHYGSASMNVMIGSKCRMCATGSVVLHKNPFDSRKPKTREQDHKDRDEDVPMVEKIIKIDKPDKKDGKLQ